MPTVQADTVFVGTHVASLAKAVESTTQTHEKFHENHLGGVRNTTTQKICGTILS